MWMFIILFFPLYFPILPFWEYKKGSKQALSPTANGKYIYTKICGITNQINATKMRYQFMADWQRFKKNL